MDYDPVTYMSPWELADEYEHQCEEREEADHAIDYEVQLHEELEWEADRFVLYLADRDARELLEALVYLQGEAQAQAHHSAARAQWHCA